MLMAKPDSNRSHDRGKRHLTDPAPSWMASYEQMRNLLGL